MQNKEIIEELSQYRGHATSLVSVIISAGTDI